MKIKIFRVVTASYVIPWHLHNTLTRTSKDFELYVIGDHVSKYRKDYQNINFIDLKINRKIHLVNDFFSLITLCFLFFKEKPDIVHSIMPKSGLLSAIAGFVCFVPIRIHTFTGQSWVTKHGIKHNLYYYIDRLIHKLNTHCLTDSPSQSVFLAEHGISNNGIPIPHLSKGSLSGVDFNKFSSEQNTVLAQKIKDSLNISDEFIFSFIARKTKEKGAIDILYAFHKVNEQFPHCKLLFIGPDEDKEIESIEKSNKALFNNVINVGHVSNHELYLSITNVLCLPSYREGFGSIIIDAAAAGVPAIGSDIAGLRDAIENTETGWLFPAGDIAMLSVLMTNCIKTPDLCKNIGNKARDRAMIFFNADLLSQKLEQFYCSAISGRKATHD